MAKQDYNPIGIGVGSVIANRYEIIRKLGAGAMSVVFAVVDRKLNNEEVALKLLSPIITEDGKAVERFRNELILTRKLTHPNIIRTYEFGETEKGQVFLTMEKVKGYSLEAIIHHRGGLGLEIKEIVYYLHEICQAIAYAHDMGIVHRDLKPGNILISTSAEVKITDFGLARKMGLEERLTQTGESVGTPIYMAPEQIEDKSPEHRIDIYAIGIIGYELITGKQPFSGKNWYELAKQIVENPLPDITKQRKGTPPWLLAIIEKATQKDPTRRFFSAHEMSEILSSHLEKLPPGYGLNLIYSTHTKSNSRFTGEATVLTKILDSPQTLRLMPILFIIGAIGLIILGISSLNQFKTNNIDLAKEKIERKTNLIGRFLNYSERFMKVVDQFEKKEEEANKYLLEQELQKATEGPKTTEEESLVNDSQSSANSEQKIQEQEGKLESNENKGTQ